MFLDRIFQRDTVDDASRVDRELRDLGARVRRLEELLAVSHGIADRGPLDGPPRQYRRREMQSLDDALASLGRAVAAEEAKRAG